MKDNVARRVRDQNLESAVYLNGDKKNKVEERLSRDLQNLENFPHPEEHYSFESFLLRWQLTSNYKNLEDF